MNRLRPCPFCGSDDVEVRSLPDEWKDDKAFFVSVVCSHCGATVTFARRECTRMFETRSFKETIEMWNMGGYE